MKKSVKKSLLGLVAVPMAAMLVGCSTPATVKAPFDANPYGFTGRTYSSQTEIATSELYTNNMAAPVFTTSTNAYVSSVANNSDGSRTVIIENVTAADYNNYSSNVSKEEEEATRFQTAVEYPGEYVVEFDDGEVVDNVGTMTINYTPETGSEIATPSAFRTVNYFGNEEVTSLYMKMSISQDAAFNDYVDMYLEYADFSISREEAIAALALEGITADSFNMAYEIALKGDSLSSYFAMGMYLESPEETYSMHMSVIGDTLRLTMHVPDGDPETADKIYGKFNAEEVEDTSLSILMLTGMMMAAIFEAPADNYDDLLSQYVSTGYEMVDGKAYYYETFGSEDDGVITYYYNGNELVYIASDGEFMEVSISTTVPARMFETKIPTGYVDQSAALLEQFQMGGF